MSITPQDILEQEFHVRFRGFDMAEVDAFLEMVAEHFSMLFEENRQLSEQLQAMQQAQIEQQAQVEQQAPAVDSRLGENLKEAIVSVREVASELKSSGRQESAADLTGTMNEIRQSTEKINAGLAALKEDSEIFSSLKEIVTSAREAVGEKGSVVHQEIPADLADSLAELKQNTEKINADLAVLKGELSSVEQGREQLKSELQDMLRSHLDKIDDRLSGESPAAVPPPFPVPEKEAPLQSAETERADQEAESVMDSPPGDEEQKEAESGMDSRPGDEEQEEAESLLDSRPSDAEQVDDDMQKEEAIRQEDTTHFNEADILNEDKLRDLFASIMDDDDSPKEAETSNDMLFGGQGLVKDDHEPEVTFILDEALEEEETGLQAGNKPDN